MINLVYNTEPIRKLMKKTWKKNTSMKTCKNISVFIRHIREGSLHNTNSQ